MDLALSTQQNWLNRCHRMTYVQTRFYRVFNTVYSNRLKKGYLKRILVRNRRGADTSILGQVIALDSQCRCYMPCLFLDPGTTSVVCWRSDSQLAFLDNSRRYSVRNARGRAYHRTVLNARCTASFCNC